MSDRFGNDGSAHGDLTPRTARAIDHEVLVPAVPLRDSNWLMEYWNIARLRWKLVLACMMLCGLSGLALVLLQWPVYAASATVEVLGTSDTFMDAQRVDPQSNIDIHTTNSQNLQTQILLLRSKALVNRARQQVEQANLAVEGLVGDRLDRLRQLIGVHRLTPARSLRKAINLAAQTVDGEVLNGTRIIEIRCESTDPKVASAFVNAIANEYVSWSSLSRLKSSQEASRELTRLLQGARNKLSEAERDLQARQLRSGVPGEKTTSLADSKVRQLQSDLSLAQADLIGKQTRYVNSLNTPADAIPEVRDDTGLRVYENELAHLRRELASLSGTLGPKNVKISQLQSQIAVIEATVKAEQSAILERIKNEYAAAKQREQLLTAEYTKQEGNVSGQQVRELSYNMAKREVDTARQEYDTLLKSAEQARVISAIPVTTAQVVDFGVPAEEPNKPQPPLYIGLGLATGTFLGWILAYVIERTSSRLRKPGELPALLKVRMLGVIPPASIDSDYRRRNGGRFPLRVHEMPDCLEVTTMKHGPSLMAESFRTVLASIMMEDDSGYRPKVIVVTSAVPREGKTVVCCNLAAAMAETGRKVLLIDGDMRRPRLASVFGTLPEPNLSQAVTRVQTDGQVQLEHLAQSTEIENLKVLPCVYHAQTARILYSEGLKRLVERFRHEFHTILIDVPPLTPVSDARVLGRLADGAILVLRSNHSQTEEAQSALQTLQQDGIPVLGAILNDCGSENKRLQYLYVYQSSGPSA